MKIRTLTAYLHAGLPLVILLLAAAPLSAGGTLSYFGITDDTSSQITSSKTYTHAVDFGQNTSFPVATVNGVAFVGKSGARFFPLGGSGTVGSGWSNIPSAHHGNGGAATNITPGSQVINLVEDFNYNNVNGAVRIQGLTVGQKYDLRLYHSVWGGNRTQDFGFHSAHHLDSPEDTVQLTQTENAVTFIAG